MKKLLLSIALLCSVVPVHAMDDLTKKIEETKVSVQEEEEPVIKFTWYKKPVTKLTWYPKKKIETETEEEQLEKLMRKVVREEFLNWHEAKIEHARISSEDARKKWEASYDEGHFIDGRPAHFCNHEYQWLKRCEGKLEEREVQLKLYKRLLNKSN